MTKALERLENESDPREKAPQLQTIIHNCSLKIAKLVCFKLVQLQYTCTVIPLRFCNTLLHHVFPFHKPCSIRFKASNAHIIAAYPADVL